MSLRTDLLSVADEFRALSGPDFADIRINQVTVRTRTWTGARLGDGDPIDSDLVLPARYPVRYLTAQEIFTANGRYEAGDILVDHITPDDGNGVGWSADQLRPIVTVDNVEIIYVLVGSHAGDYRLLDIRNYRAFTTQLVLRRRAETP